MNGFFDFMRRFQPGGAPMPTTVPDQRIPGQIDPTMGMRIPSEKKVPKPRRWQDAAYMIGAGLKEASGESGQVAAAQQMFAGREQQARMQEIRDGLPPEQQVLFDLSPEAWVKAYGMPAKPEAPAYIEGPDGIYERGADGWQKATAYPEAASKAPDRIEGPDGIYEKQPDGSWKKVANFGAAPRIFAPQRPAAGRQSAPAGAPDLRAIEAELRKRGVLK